MNTSLRIAVIVFLVLFLGGCAIIKPQVTEQVSTPIDYGLTGEFEQGITVHAFTAGNDAWGAWAGRLMQEKLLEHGAFRRVTVAAAGPVTTPYVLEGEIRDVYFGGTSRPTRVNVEVRVVDATDGNTRFLQRRTLLMRYRGYDASRLHPVYPQALVPEELLSRALDDIAADIAERTSCPVPGCPENS